MIRVEGTAAGAVVRAVSAVQALALWRLGTLSSAAVLFALVEVAWLARRRLPGLRLDVVAVTAAYGGLGMLIPPLSAGGSSCLHDASSPSGLLWMTAFCLPACVLLCGAHERATLARHAVSLAAMIGAMLLVSRVLEPGPLAHVGHVAAMSMPPRSP